MAVRRALGPRGEPSRAPLGAAAVSHAHSGMGGAGTKGAPLALLSLPPRVLTPGLTLVLPELLRPPTFPKGRLAEQRLHPLYTWGA